jgi:hypothetical protein
VTVFDAGQATRLSPVLASFAVSGVTVAIGSKTAETDATGSFSLLNIPTGDQVVTFSKDDAIGTYFLADVEPGETFLLDEIQYSGGNVATKHTGTWVGTGGSTDPGSQGQIALTMIIAQNGNAISGTASVEPPDNSVWNIVDATETGHSVSGRMEVVSSDSDCASGGTFEGTFVANTLEGTFDEVHPDDGSLDHCGPNEHGTFRVEKQ